MKYFCQAYGDFRCDDDLAVLTASEYCHLEVVKYLCEAGLDFRSGNNQAVQYTSYFGHLEVVKYLCEIGADFRSDNNCAVRWASRNGHYEVVKYLCQVGANISKISEKARKYIAFCKKMEVKNKERAQKRIYFWWIPICYDVNRECGKRMMLKNLEKAKELGLEFI